MRIGHRGKSDTDRQRGSSMRLWGLIVILAAVLLAAGCAHQKAYKRGSRLSEEGQFEKAIAELEEAVKLAEDKNKDDTAQRYREKLDEVKHQAAQFYYREAEIRFGRADLGAAQMFIERCVKYVPQELSYSAFRRRIVGAIADAEQVRSEALALAEEKQWKPAIDRMNEALNMYKTLPGGDGDLRQIQERAYQHYIARAREKLWADDLAAVEIEVQAAQAYRADGKEAKELLQTVKDRRQAAGLTARGRRLLEQKNYEEALRVLEQARALHPSQGGLVTLLPQAREAVCDKWLAQGRQAMEAGQYAAALGWFRRSDELLRGRGGVDALMTEAKSRLAEAHLAAAQRHSQDGLSGAAVLHAVMALGYQPSHFEARRQLGLYAGHVRQDVRYTIEFAGFETAPQHRPIAEKLASAALEHLTRTGPANVRVVESRVPQNPADPQAGASNVTREGSDALLAGQMLDAKVTSETKQTGQGESTYQDGMIAEPNPDYVQAAAELDAALKQLERARVRLAEANARLARYDNADPGDSIAMARKRRAQADVDEAQQRLLNAVTRVGTAQIRAGAIPPEVLVPNMVVYQFPIQQVTWTARVECMVKMADVLTGELLLAERLEGVHAQSDQFVAGDAARNVPEDPLDLPTDAALLDTAANGLMGKLKQILSAACERHGDRFATQMQRAEAAGDAVGAVDSGIKYLFAYPKGRQDTKKIVSFLHQYLGAEDSLVDMHRLLQTHCHVLQK